MRKGMEMKQMIFKRIGLLVAAFALAATAQAQPAPGVFPFGGTTTTPRSTGSRNSSYPNSTDIGQARITYDAETRSVIVVADEETAAHIKEVVGQLDRPAPQVLIKCVFMEATYSKDTDIGVDGKFVHHIKSSKVDELNGATGT